MSDWADLLDQAMLIGEQELALLGKGDVEATEALAQERGRLTSEACACISSADKSEVMGRLIKLREIQGLITASAVKLWEDTRSKINSTKKEVKRFSAYSGATRPARSIPNRYLNKEG